MKEILVDALKSTGYRMEDMTQLQSIFFREKIINSYFEGNKHRYLWEHFKNIDEIFSVRDSKAWAWLDDFLEGKETIIFLKNQMIRIFIYFLKSNLLLDF
ncbi:MAG: hypothetical protein H7A25_22080 [Leptospiraceae bacterium]|nr:hypothetical protein [Leptospiraceae bacterium]